MLLEIGLYMAAIKNFNDLSAVTRLLCTAQGNSVSHRSEGIWRERNPPFHKKAIYMSLTSESIRLRRAVKSVASVELEPIKMLHAGEWKDTVVTIAK